MIHKFSFQFIKITFLRKLKKKDIICNKRIVILLGNKQAQNRGRIAITWEFILKTYLGHPTDCTHSPRHTHTHTDRHRQKIE